MNESKYSIHETAHIFGVSTQWMYKAIKERKIRHLRIGRRIFIPESVLNEYLEASIVEVNEK